VRRRNRVLVGEKRILLARLLEQEGIVVAPVDIDPAEGRWRNKTAGDGTRWWARGQAMGMSGLPDGFPLDLNGYDTMTACVRRGIQLHQDSRDGVWHYDVYAK
jgi:hypothetical protein